MLTYTLNDNTYNMFTILYPEHCINRKKVLTCVCRYNYVCMCVRTRESTFSWCLKKSSMMHDDHSHWQPD